MNVVCMRKYLLCFVLIFLFPINILFAQLLSFNEDHTLFQYEDGSPFLWLGDTAWELFHVLNREETIYYLDNRSSKGFTVVLSVLISERNGLSIPNAYGELPLVDKNPRRPNEKYFQHVDFVVTEAKKRGLFVGILPTWADKVTNERKGEGAIFTLENAYEYGRFLGKRYKNEPVIWILGGDRDVDSKETAEIWEQMGKGIRAGDEGQHLITFHPLGEKSSAYWFHHAEWLDFNSYQSGHARRYDKVYLYNQYHRLLVPSKPIVNIEPLYEKIPVRFWEYFKILNSHENKKKYLHADGLIKDPSLFEDGFFNEYDVRVSAYWTLLSGAAGYTYGNNAVWQMFKPGTYAAVPAFSYWKEALDDPGAESMSHLISFFKKYPLNSFYPDQTLIWGKNEENENYITSVMAKDQSFVIAYLPQRKKISLNLYKLKGEKKYYWYNPSNGDYSNTYYLGKCNYISLMPPSNNQDWLLIIERISINK